MRQASARTSGNEREREETSRYLPLLAEMPAPRLIAQFEAQQFGLHLGQRDPQDVLREALMLIEQRRAAA